MKVTQFIIQKKYGDKWKDYQPISGYIPPFQNFLQSEARLAGIMAEEEGIFRVVSRSSEEHVIVEKSNV